MTPSHVSLDGAQVGAHVRKKASAGSLARGRVLVGQLEQGGAIQYANLLATYVQDSIGGEGVQGP